MTIPLYRTDEIEWKPDDTAPALMKTFSGEFMKVGLVRYAEGVAPPPHFHPNEEQFICVLEGKLPMVLGDETTTIEPGDLVHISRYLRLGILPVEGHCVFFTCKPPVGDGRMSQDYNRAEDADEAMADMAKMEG